MYKDIDFEIDHDLGIVKLMGGGDLLAELSPEGIRDLVDRAIDVLGVLEGREFYLACWSSRYR